MASSLPRVVLLHDRLHGPRIWGRFRDALRPYAEPLTVEVPQPPGMGGERWPSDIARAARAALGGTAAVALAYGSAAAAAVDLLAEGTVHAAVLLDPQPPAALAEEAVEARGRPPEIDERAVHMLLSLAEFGPALQAGSLSVEDQIRFVDVVMSQHPEVLEPPDRALVRDVFITEMGHWMRACAASADSEADPAPDRTPWIEVASGLGDRIVLAADDRSRATTEVIARHLPDVTVVDLGDTGGCPWLVAPARLAEIVAARL